MPSRKVGLVVGDSLGNGATEFPDLLDWPVQNLCDAGDRIVVNIEPVFTTSLAESPTGSAFCVIQGGVNDVDDGTAAATIQAAIDSMVGEVNALGMEAIVVSIAPWGASSNWNASKQTVTEAYNASLAASAASVGYTFVDVYTPLQDGTTPENLAAEYDSGDGIHPTPLMSRVMAETISTAMAGLSLYGSGNYATNLWKGAEQPDGLWKGASQPASPSSADALIYGVTSFVTRNITRGVTESWSN